MSLLRLFPSLRTPSTQRICVSAFSSSAPHQFPDTIPVAAAEEHFDQLMPTSNRAAPPKVASRSEGFRDDGPPKAPPHSYSREPARVNPLKAGKQTTERQQLPLYAVSVKASRNNTIVTFARDGGNQIVTLTGGKLGFKKSNRNGYEAGYQCAVGILEAMEKEMLVKDYEWELYLKGFGQGRDAMLTAITASMGEKVKSRLRRITDRTPLKIGGTRGQKTRRV